MIAGAVAASLLMRRSQRPLGLPRRAQLSIALSGFVGAMVFAKLPFLIFATNGSGSWILGWLSDGKTVLWALAGGYLGVELGKRLAGITQRTGDTFVVPVASAIAIGRLGCLLYGCCFGVPTALPWGMTFALAGDPFPVPRHPTQLYEMLFHCVSAIVAGIAIKDRILRGYWFLLYLIAYGIFRFATEFLRPEPGLAGGLTFYQWSALGIIMIFGGILAGRLLRDRIANCAVAEITGGVGSIAGTQATAVDRSRPQQ